MASSSPAVQLASARRETPLPPGAPFYRRLWHGWQRIARAFGMLLSRTVTTVIYFVAVTPFALGLKLFSDPLELKPGSAHWTSVPPDTGIDDARRGF
ncbi:MAG: hypothetical protein A2W00_04750 [Candidatus Eisenbacteria bacterium RBG_16_71_46]|nr:MAG: hypothetical protein A2W00_04750 [Candidatus Eisenbacteria bacterium RBG_16_71_46]